MTVSVRREGDSAVLEVADRGPGVPAGAARARLRALRPRRRRRRAERRQRPRPGDRARRWPRPTAAASSCSTPRAAAPASWSRCRSGRPASVRSDRRATVFRRLEPAPDPEGASPVKSILRRRPSPALVIACIALFVSLGGVSYGVATGFIDSREIRNNTVTQRRPAQQRRCARSTSATTRCAASTSATVRSRAATWRFNTLTGEDINESTLGKVPSATRRTAPPRSARLRTLIAPTSGRRGRRAGRRSCSHGPLTADRGLRCDTSGEHRGAAARADHRGGLGAAATPVRSVTAGDGPATRWPSCLVAAGPAQRRRTASAVVASAPSGQRAERAVRRARRRRGRRPTVRRSAASRRARAATA